MIFILHFLRFFVDTVTFFSDFSAFWNWSFHPFSNSSPKVFLLFLFDAKNSRNIFPNEKACFLERLPKMLSRFLDLKILIKTFSSFLIGSRNCFTLTGLQMIAARIIRQFVKYCRKFKTAENLEIEKRRILKRKCRMFEIAKTAFWERRQKSPNARNTLEFTLIFTDSRKKSHLCSRVAVARAKKKDENFFRDFPFSVEFYQLRKIKNEILILMWKHLISDHFEKIAGFRRRRN